MNTALGTPDSPSQLEEMLSRPTPGVVEALGTVKGDILILGAGGKMGPSLAVMARRASDMAGVHRQITAISRFGDVAIRNYLTQNNVEVLPRDLLLPDAIDTLPEAPNLIYMAGLKFGTTHHRGLTWAMNTWLPGLVCDRYHTSRAVIFSTGNVYGLTPVAGGGSREEDVPAPVGEYAMSALGRERIFEYFAHARGMAQSIIRLNYACDLRYGVLVDIARKVMDGTPVPLSMGYLNTIWQGDANAMILSSLAHTADPPLVLNVTGSQVIRVRDAATYFGKKFDREPVFEGEEAEDALLSNSARAVERFGPPQVDEETLLGWIADWLLAGRPLLNKPTHFEARNGQF